jgi:hypothetical protein
MLWAFVDGETELILLKRGFAMFNDAYINQPVTQLVK